MASDPVDRLHPVVVHHIVNTLGWTDLRPLQREAVAPLLAGEDALLLAPTAGGKTEAAMFPLLSRMAAERWDGPSLLYLCPLKALLNNLLPRIEGYAGWLGRRAAVWHGDVTASRRRGVLSARPDILLTTPESLESMLVSTRVDHRDFLAGIRAIVVDEVHAFAGDDRGWHLLAVLDRLTHLLGRPLQRVGLSATVGNPQQLLTWLQGSGAEQGSGQGPGQGAGAGRRPGRVIAPEDPASHALTEMSGRGMTTAGAGIGRPPPGNIELDYVGTLENAATVIAALHAGEKRLVFCESRQAVEQLGQLLRARGLTTFLSHASLSADERRRAEDAFAQSRDCVIVSTSTLELGIDVGDLDRVIQIDAPDSVASFLQRLGRTGRRQGTTRNCLFLTRSTRSLLQAAGLLLLWSRGWVEHVVPPPEPRHIVAQQILALCLQEHRVGEHLYREWWNGLGPFRGGADVILRHLVEQGFLDRDSGMLFIGPAAELRFGRRHFMEMTTVFVGAPEFTVQSGRTELGKVDPSLLVEDVAGGERRLLLGGRSWRVTYIDWRRRRCFVEPADGGGRARWLTGGGWGGISFELAQAARQVLLGSDPPVRLTRRAAAELAVVRSERSHLVWPDGTVIWRSPGGDLEWWTWAGFRTNATLVATLGEVTDSAQRFDDYRIRLREGLTPAEWRTLTADAPERLCLPEPSEKALVGLKFSDALPKRLALATLAERLADLPNALASLQQPVRFVAT
jgi:ATP-dependent Lhr-like helicase